MPETLSTGVKFMAKPSGLHVPPWQMVSSLLGGVGLRTATLAEACAKNGGAILTRSELADLAGLDDAGLAELEAYGFLKPSLTSSDRALFDDDALAIAKIAQTFMQYGIEPRHLRMYRAFVEREASLHASNVQLVCPECGAQTRVGHKMLGDGRKVRVCRKCEGVVDK